MQQALSTTALGFLGNLQVGVSLDAELAPSRIAPLPEVKPGFRGAFLDTLRANLNAAARHAVLGHTGPSFRECSGPACREAAILIPEMDPVQGAATDAELDAIVDEVLSGLAMEGMPFLAPTPS